MELLKKLREQRRELLASRTTAAAEARAAVNKAAEDGRTELNEAETATHTEKRAAIAKLDTDIAELETRISELESDERAETAAKEARATGVAGQERPEGGAVITSEPMVYGEGSRSSYFLDLARTQTGQGNGDGGVEAARDRLARHAAELKVELPAREARREARARTESRSAFGEQVSPFEKRTNPNRTDGQGGYFVPPLWLIDEYIPFLRAGRTIANSVRNLTLPGGTDSINLPKVATGTGTAAQTADAAPVTSTDMTDSTISAPVRTLAGQQDVAIQLLDQSPISFDQVIMQDLLADYNRLVDRQVIFGTGLNGQVAGIFGISGKISVSYTDGSPTAPELFPAFAQALAQQVATRFLPPTAIFMHPQVWYWLLGQLDSSSRPFITVNENGPFNALALQTGTEGEGPVGRIMGLPVLLDPNIQVNLGSGTNESAIYLLRTPDLYLWEGAMRSRTLTEVLSGTLQVRFQLYNYIAFLATRFPSSVATITGTGLIGQTGYTV